MVPVTSEMQEYWVKHGGDEFEEILSSGAVKLLDSEFLIKLAGAGGVLAPRQALPPEATVVISGIKGVLPPKRVLK